MSLTVNHSGVTVVIVRSWRTAAKTLDLNFVLQRVQKSSMSTRLGCNHRAGDINRVTVWPAERYTQVVRVPLDGSITPKCLQMNETWCLSLEIREDGTYYSSTGSLFRPSMVLAHDTIYPSRICKCTNLTDSPSCSQLTSSELLDAFEKTSHSTKHSGQSHIRLAS